MLRLGDRWTRPRHYQRCQTPRRRRRLRRETGPSVFDAAPDLNTLRDVGTSGRVVSHEQADELVEVATNHDAGRPVQRHAQVARHPAERHHEVSLEVV